LMPRRGSPPERDQGHPRPRTRGVALCHLVKVPDRTARAGKQIPPPKDKHQKKRKGHPLILRDGTEEEHPSFTFDGYPHIEGIAEGQKVAVPLTRKRTRRIRDGIERFRLYGDYRVPADARLPELIHNATVSIRASRTEDDGSYNRAEHLRPITIHDRVIGPNPDPTHQSEFDQLYVLRPGAESINRWFKAALHRRTGTSGRPTSHHVHAPLRDAAQQRKGRTCVRATWASRGLTTVRERGTNAP